MKNTSAMNAELSYSGHEALDRDHELLVRVTEKLRAHPEEFPNLRAEALAYLESHFEHEEQLMYGYDYPGFADHKAGHDRCYAQMTALPSEDACIWADRLEKWLGDEVLGADRLFSNFLHEHNLSPVGEHTGIFLDVAA